MSTVKYWVSQHYLSPMINGDYTPFDYSSFKGEQEKFDEWMSDNVPENHFVTVISDADSPELKRCSIVGVLSNCVQIAINAPFEDEDEDDEESRAEARYYSRLEDSDYAMECCVKECEWESRL